MKKTKAHLIQEIGLLIGEGVMVELKNPFVADKSGNQEEVVAVFKDEQGNLEINTWNFDNGGNRKEEVFNASYPLDGDLLTWDDLAEIKKQLLDSDIKPNDKIKVKTTSEITTFQIKNAGINTPAAAEEMRKKLEKFLNAKEDVLDGAFYLLRAVLTESGMENEFDQTIYDFLKEQKQLPKGYKPYWK